ncbi:hypothetical protein KJR22_02630 [Streptococcus infantarius subsp. infantarius]|uniref:hypothetical protein n=1 Tax=Streptococcus infantarius TaxID=102684 RepID=UPI001BD9652D|nr:hypothetical protein [Streptococcus infantarius]MBT0896045.1 hypothetical protein [Streptococcus infantarius subsp. infantarius]MBT0899895.1 hypothetical protein [Streptococcus infantarius subsp. infantarius]MBT1033534.1 hypothetical protein [Streptococcus infantarius subsp. infantarius]
MSKWSNNLAAKHCVGWYEHHEETPLDVLEEFVNWTKVKHLKSYITIADMLHVTRNEAKRLLDLAALPDDVTVKRMKELMR